MRSCLAILKDSFREALASRVLLITLFGIIAVLALLAPFGLETGTSTQLRRSEMRRPERLLETLTAGAEQQATPAAHLWSLLNDEQREQIQELLNPSNETSMFDNRPGANPLIRKLVDQLNKLIKDPDFYDAESWTNVRLNDETKSLVEKSSLSEVELKRRNLMLLADAFPTSIDIVDSNAISLTYGTAVVQGPMPFTPSQFEPFFNQMVVAVVTVFLGFFGVFGCLLVTAGLIPRTFEPGEIALLLSKPVSRSVLFVVKFLGGCVFTLIYATVLVTGIWLLLGLRMDSWRHELLWCIPVYVFLFMIYYSVSAVAGAIWRNAIVALAIVVVFWLGLTVIGIANEALRQNLIRERGIREIVVAGPDLITIDGEQNTWLWDDDKSAWREIYKEPPTRMGPFARMFLSPNVRFAPVYDAADQRILTLKQSVSRFGGAGPSELIAGYADDGWERVSIAKVPEFVPVILLSRAGRAGRTERIILPAADTIYEYVGKPEEDSDGGDKATGEFLSSITGGLLGKTKNGFRELQPSDMPDLGEGFAAAIDPATDDLVVYGNGTLHHLDAADDGRYTLKSSRDFETDSAGVLAVSGDRILLGLSDGMIRVLNKAHLETIAERQLADGVLPRACAAAPDSSGLAVVTHDDTVFAFDRSSDTLQPWTHPITSVCSAIAYDNDDHLLVADGRLAVTACTVNGNSGAVVQAWSEPTTWVYQFYDYVIHPLWSTLPRPSQLDEFVTYVTSGEKAMIVNDGRGPGELGRNNLSRARETFDPVPVIRDNAIFVLVMLAIGCLYISRRDF